MRLFCLSHDILVFLTGQEEIVSIANIIKDITKYNIQQGSFLLVFCCYKNVQER